MRLRALRRKLGSPIVTHFCFRMIIILWHFSTFITTLCLSFCENVCGSDRESTYVTLEFLLIANCCPFAELHYGSPSWNEFLKILVNVGFIQVSNNVYVADKYDSCLQAMWLSFVIEIWFITTGCNGLRLMHVIAELILAIARVYASPSFLNICFAQRLKPVQIKIHTDVFVVRL